MLNSPRLQPLGSQTVKQNRRASIHLILSYLILSYLILSYLILSYLILSYPISSLLFSSHLISSHLISSHLISSHLISSHLISSHLISSHLISSHLISSHLNSSHLISSYLILSCKNLGELMSKLFDATGENFHPTRYRQVVETACCRNLSRSARNTLCEEQKHSSVIVRVRYQNQQSRKVGDSAH